MDTLYRLAWALPLVLMVGFAVMLMLKRFVVPTVAASQAPQRMSLRESLSLPDDTRVHLIEVDRQAYLIVESTRHTLLQSIEAQRTPVRAAPPWMQRFYKAGSR